MIVAITGLPKKEGIVRYILTTFQAFQEYAKLAREDANLDEPSNLEQAPAPDYVQFDGGSGRLQLAYNINTVLPERTNVEVYNSIFRSLKANLLP